MASVGKTFSIKELKSRLDENELDLSLSELRVVPVQELSHPQLSKVTSLDLSDNKLSTLPDAFCSLTNLCRLNLSSNQLRELPDDFGNLVNVVHLDLYRNKLEDLPASMHRMRSLKWLDLKDNPLDTELARAAGQCLDEKQCKIAAQNVLKYLASVQARIDRAKNKKAEQQKAEAAKERALEEEKRREVQAKKRREKEQRKNENRQKFQDAERKSQVKSDKMNGSPPGKSDKSRAANKTGGIRAESAKSPSVILKCCKLLFQLLYFVFIMGVCTILVTAAAFYSNCTMGHKWIPKSEPLCRDFFSWASTGETPPTVRLHAQMTLSASAEAIRSLAANATKHDYAAAAGNLYEAGRRLTVKTWDRSVVLYHERISPAMSNATVIAREYALVAGHYLTVGLDYAIGFAVIGFHWLIERTSILARWAIRHASNFYENSDKYWERLKHYWENVK